MPQQDTEVFEVLLRQVPHDRKVNGVLGEALAILPESERRQPLGNAFHSGLTGRNTIHAGGFPTVISPVGLHIFQFIRGYVKRNGTPLGLSRWDNLALVGLLFRHTANKSGELNDYSV